LVGPAFDAGGCVDGTRKSWDIVLGEWWRRCELKISVEIFVVPTDLLGLDASEFTDLFERMWQAFETAGGVHAGGRYPFNGVASEHFFPTHLTIKINSAVVERAGEFECTDEASDFAETGAERAVAT
jgi:hypothetical protein